LTAPNANSRADAAANGGWSAGESVIENVTRLCKSAIVGRRAARMLAEWTKRFELSEAEFHVLWQLRSAPGDGLDQTTLAGELTFSPAQVSTTVERLRKRLLIFQHAAPGDRRRRLWQLSAGGRKLIDQMLYAAAQLRGGTPFDSERAESISAREAAA
jgi:DNA-binding MarR family transcriptional regulator